MNKYLSFFLATFLLFGCSDAPDDKRQTESTNSAAELRALQAEIAAVESHPRRSPDEALDIATEAIRRDHPQMRAAHIREAFDVEVLSLNDNRAVRGAASDDADSAVYVCNLAHDGGFVLVSGDRRVPELLGYASSGALHIDSIDPGHPLTPFLVRLPEFYAEKRAEFAKKKRLLHRKNGAYDFAVCDDREGKGGGGGGGGSHNPPKTECIWDTLEWKDQYTPARMLVQSAWNQGVPYNFYAPVIDGTKAPSGCVSVAVGQLMAFHKFPSHVDACPIDWELLTLPKYRRAPLRDDYQHPFHLEVSKLLRKIGDALHNQWGKNSTPAYEHDIPPFLISLGYTVPQKPIIDYNEKDLLESLRRGQPVITGGYSEKSTYLTGMWPFRKKHTKYDGGHEWLIDGYLPQKRVLQYVEKKSRKILETKTEERLLVHCNWGWDGACNGFFLSGIFNTNKAEREDPYIELIREEQQSPKNTRSPENKGNYRYHITIIPYVHP